MRACPATRSSVCWPVSSVSESPPGRTTRNASSSRWRNKETTYHSSFHTSHSLPHHAGFIKCKDTKNAREMQGKRAKTAKKGCTFSSKNNWTLHAHRADFRCTLCKGWKPTIQTLIEGRADFRRSASKVPSWMSAQKCAHKQKKSWAGLEKMCSITGSKFSPLKAFLRKKAAKTSTILGQKYGVPWMSA